MMKVITGDKYNSFPGLVVVCDPESVKAADIHNGDHVMFEGCEYVVAGTLMTSRHIEEIPVVLKRCNYGK